MVKISASLMCANWLRLEEEIRALEEAGIDTFHLDVMDGAFVSNFAMNFWQIDAIRQATKKPLEVHMMVNEPSRYIHRLAQSGVNSIIFHVERCTNLDSTLREIKDHGIQAGAALEVETPTATLIDCLDSVDNVLFMATRSGFMGQRFRPEVVPKLAAFVRSLKEGQMHPGIVGDGHISRETIPLLAQEGMDTFVGGTRGLFNSEAGGYQDKIRQMREAAQTSYRW